MRALINPGVDRGRLDGLIDALERAGVQGRGGAAFPTGTKLRAVAGGRGRPIVVVNAAEGEPLSAKDRYLLNGRLDTVLDGAFAAAEALGSDEIILALDERMRHESLAISDGALRRAGDSRRDIQARVELVPSGYITGQETALISALNGGPAKPTMTPPYPFERGVRGRPTLVSNTETYSDIGRVARGTYTGTRLITVGGAVARPGLIDIADTTSLAAVVHTAGGLTESARGVLLGGYGGTWTRLNELTGVDLNERSLRERRLTLGAGIVFLLGESACPVSEVARVAGWMAGESAGQCGPCVHGLGAIAGALVELTAAGDQVAAYGQIRRWSESVRKRGACAHPDGVARFVLTALGTFTHEFDDHARHGGCDACLTPTVLPTPSRRRGSSRAGQTTGRSRGSRGLGAVR